MREQVREQRTKWTKKAQCSETEGRRPRLPTLRDLDSERSIDRVAAYFNSLLERDAGRGRGAALAHRGLQPCQGDAAVAFSVVVMRGVIVLVISGKTGCRGVAGWPRCDVRHRRTGKERRPVAVMGNTKPPNSPASFAASQFPMGAGRHEGKHIPRCARLSLDSNRRRVPGAHSDRGCGGTAAPATARPAAVGRCA